MSPVPSLQEIITGWTRPRHLRFAAAIEDLVPGALVERRYLNRWQRLQINALRQVTGVRRVRLPLSGVPTILHQALADTTVPHVVEFDVPHGVHGYSYAAYL